MEDLYKSTQCLLYSYKAMKAEIKNIDLEITELENEYEGCKATTFEEKSAPTNKFNSSVENETVIREDKPKQLKRKKQKLESLVKKIDNALEALEPREYEIIKIRYFDRVSNKKMGIRLELSEPHLCKLKKRVIEKLSKIINI